MHLKRNVIDVLVGERINKFILIGENVLNFHGSDDSYYEEWFEDARLPSVSRLCREEAGRTGRVG